MKAIVITIESTDESDLPWLRDKCVPAVEEIVLEQEDRLDGTATVYWEFED
jgi:hypothetical protein